MPSLAALDLHLLQLFEALLAERHLTRAAARVGLAQPSASKGLDRLRRLFGDPLFLRAPGGMAPTARALALAPEVAALLGAARGLLAERAPFDPARAEGVVRLALSDGAELALAPALLARLMAEAPGVALRVRPLDKDRLAEDLDAGRLDAAVGVVGPLPGRLASRALREDRFVCLARADHPALARGLTLEAFCALPHLLVTLRDDARGAVDEALGRLGRARRIAATLPRFLAVPAALRATDALATLPARAARSLGTEGLAAHAPPLALPGWTERLVWSRATEADPLLTWARGLVDEIGAAG